MTPTLKSLKVLQLQAQLFQAQADEARERPDQAVFVAYYEARAKGSADEYEKARAKYSEAFNSQNLEKCRAIIFGVRKTP